MRFRSRRDTRRGTATTEVDLRVRPEPDSARRAEELDRIDTQISRLFRLVAEGLEAATDAFLHGDAEAGSRVARAEVRIDELQGGTELLVNEQLRSVSDGIDPHALSRLILALRIVPELERSGDLVEHIAARASAVIVDQLPDAVLTLIARMSSVGEDLWRRAARSFEGTPVSDGPQLRLLDDELDDLHVQLCDELAYTNLPVAVAIEMGLVARFYERLGDHAVNVARRVDAELVRPDPC